MSELLTGETWLVVADANSAAHRLARRHYSARHYRDGRRSKKFVGPGAYLALLTPDERAVCIFKKFRDASGEKGVCLSLFRNESERLASKLIVAACQAAWCKWPGERLYTYVNTQKVRGTNPGYCFLRAGWRRAGWTRGGLLVLERLAAARGGGK